MVERTSSERGLV